MGDNDVSVCTTFVGDVISGGGYACVTAEVCEKSLCLPLTIAVNLNLL